jgi:serine/threonine protein kinase
MKQIYADILTPAQQLEGKVLDGGWVVRNRVETGPGTTGGHFSSGYVVESREGKRAFLKALDYSKSLRSVDPARALQSLTEAFNFERDMLEMCKGRRLDRVVRSITSGKTEVDGIGGGVVQYLIFELADGDVRKHLDISANFDVAWVLRSLHQMATGLMQLHRIGIAHQDLKPSNVLIFDKTSKVSDLGSAAHSEFNLAEDVPIPGDDSYAPPELLYKYLHTEWRVRRFGCDAYLLGSMAVFFFTRMSMTSLLTAEMHEQHKWYNWTGTYKEVLPYIRDAYVVALQNISGQLPHKLSNEVTEVIRQLCDPDPELRGHPMMRTRGPLTLERYVTKFNVLATKAERGIFV